MPPADRNRRKPFEQTAWVLTGIAKRFKLHLRLAREMRRDGYLRLVPEEPEFALDGKAYTHEGVNLHIVRSHYGLSEEKFLTLHTTGHIDLNGLDCESAISRYVQRHGEQLSVRLLCYLVYDAVRPNGGKIENQVACDYLSSLKIGGKLSPPKDLEHYLDDACRGQPAALERVAVWMRDLIDSIDKPQGWAFYGVRLALTEGSYELWNRPVPKLRKWAKRRKLAKLLREHPLLRGCVTPVARSKRNNDYFYVYHRPGAFWDM